MLANLAVRHVGVLPGRCSLESPSLGSAGLGNLFAHLGTATADRGGGQFLVGHRRHFDVNVDPVQQRPTVANRLQELNFVQIPREN